MTGDARPQPGVDIVVPIYNARRDVERCVESVLRHASGDWRLVLVDDASTDESLVQFLRDAAGRDERVIHLRNKENSGFIVTANRGLRAAQGRDVLLLNSDTIVTPGFLDKHIACVYADETTGIASPFTNNGTICSIPEFCRDNELPDGLSVDEYGALIAAVTPRARPEIVTGVGFCMYVRAAVIEQIGVFDERSFGRGFGEENDFCERAKKRGWKIRLVDDCFVAHTGKASFGAEGGALERENSRTLARMHPNYFADVAAFCAENPLRAHQDRIRFELARHRMRRYPAALFVLHASLTDTNGGGTEHFVRGLVERLALPRALVIWPEGRELVAVEIGGGAIDEAVRYRFELPHEPDIFCRRDEDIEAAFDAILSAFDVAFVHFHHLIRWPIRIWRRAHDRGIPYALTIHDYYAICPNWNLVRRDSGRACPCPGAADADATTACMAAQFAALDMAAPQDAVDLVESHRREFGALLQHAGIILSPSQAAADVVARYHGESVGKVRVIGHGYNAVDCETVSSETDDRTAPGPLRVAVIGQVAYPAKGAEAYLTLMERTRGLPIEWHVFGAVDVFDYRRRLAAMRMGGQLVVHGDYDREKIVSLLRDHRIDLSLFLPQAAETFCFTLSESWMAGVPALVSNRGALPERVHETRAGLVVESEDEAFERLRAFTLEADRLAPLRAAARAFRHPTIEENARRHLEAYGELIRPFESPVLAESITEKDDRLFDAHRRQLDRGRAGVIQTPSHHTRWWYPHYLRIKPMIPPAWRGRLKRAYLRWRGDKVAQS